MRHVSGTEKTAAPEFRDFEKLMVLIVSASLEHVSAAGLDVNAHSLPKSLERGSGKR